MEKMQKQARQTDRAVEQLGRKLDRVFGRDLNRRIETQERAWSNLNRESSRYDDVANRVEKDNGRISRSFKQTENDVGRMERGMRKLVIITEGFGRILSAVKLPMMFGAIGAAIGFVIQGVVALGGGLVALVPQVVGAVGALASLIPKLTDLGGIVGALPATFLGFGLAMVTVKLATRDLTKAYAGNAAALKRLDPEGKKFLKTLQSYKPTINALRGTAQRGLFPGLTTALKELRAGVPTVNGLIGGTARQLGGLATRAAGQFTQQGFLLDLTTVGQQGIRIIGTLGRSFLYLLQAVRHVAVAAEPFTEWLRKTVEGFAKYIAHSARAGRESGRLAAFFDRAKSALILFGHITRNVIGILRDFGEAWRPTGNSLWRSIEKATRAWDKFLSTAEGQTRLRMWIEHARVGLSNIWRVLVNLSSVLVSVGKAAGGLGDSLWGSARRTTKGWAEAARSVTGQFKMIRFFNSLRDSIKAVSRLIFALSRGVMGLGNQQGFPALVDKLTAFVPTLERIIAAFERAFGGPLLDLLNTLGQTVQLLAGASGPLALLIKMLDGLLKVVNALVSGVPGLGRLLTAALSVAGIYLAIQKVRTLGQAWFGVADGANAAAAAEERATGVTAVGRGGRAGRGGMGVPVGFGGTSPATVPFRAGAVSPGAVGFERGAGQVVTPGGLTRAEVAAREARGVPLVLPLAAGGRFGLRGLFRRVLGRGGGPRFLAGAAGSGGVAEELGIGARLGLRAGALGLAARGALGAVGRFAWPIAAIGALFGAATAPRQGSFGMRSLQTLAGGVSGASFGLIPRIKTGDERSNERVQRVVEGFDERTGPHTQAFFHGFRSLVGFGPGSGPVVHHRGVSELADPHDINQARQQIGFLRGSLRQLRGEEGSEAGAARRSIQERIGALKQLIGQQNRYRRELARTRQQMEGERGERDARTYLSRYGAEFSRMLKRMGTGAALERTLPRFTQRFKAATTDRERKTLSRIELGWASDEARRARKSGNETAAEEYESFHRRLQGRILRIWRQGGENVQIVNDRILTNSRSQWVSIGNALVGAVKNAQGGVTAGFAQIQQIAVGSLKTMGYSAAQASQLVSGIATGTITPGQASSAAPYIQSGAISTGDVTGPRHARGGRIAGSGLRDTVPVGGLAAPGELIVNRHTESRVDRMLRTGFGTTLGREVGSEQRPHSMFATGGRAGGTTTTGAVNVVPAVNRLISTLTTRFPLTVTSTTGGQHAKNSYHYRGMAVDLAGSPAVMNQASTWIKQSGLSRSLLEGIHNPNLSVKFGRAVPPSFWGASTWAGHVDHIHLAAQALRAAAADGGGGTVMRRLLGKLRVPGTALGGVPGALVTAAQAAYAVALRRRINSAARHAAGGPGEASEPGVGKLPGGTQGANEALARRMMLAQGFARTEWPSLKALWMRESGFNETATNPSSGAYGIPQALPASKLASAGQDWRTNPATQIRWGLGYISDRYGTPSAAFDHEQQAGWYAKGGRLHESATHPAMKATLGDRIPFDRWFRDGGTATYHRPTLIGVGDRPGGQPETVTVSHGRQGGQPTGIRIGRIVVQNHKDGDIQKQIEREVRGAFRTLSHELALQPMVDDEAAND